jgi:hypothetical protein
MVDYTKWPEMKIERLGLTLPANFPLEEWVSLGQRLFKAGIRVKGYQWQLGDWLIFGEKYSLTSSTQAEYQAARDSVIAAGYGKSTLYDVKYVAKRFERRLRRESIPFSQYRAIASKSPQERGRLLTAIEKTGAKRERVRQAARGQALSSSIEKGSWEIDEEYSTNGSLEVVAHVGEINYARFGGPYLRAHITESQHVSLSNSEGKTLDIANWRVFVADMEALDKIVKMAPKLIEKRNPTHKNGTR